MIFFQRSISVDLNRPSKRVAKSIQRFSRQPCSPFTICNLGSWKTKLTVILVFSHTGSNKIFEFLLRPFMRDSRPNFKDVFVKKLLPSPA